VDRLPFTVYDFFAYLSAGFLLLVGITTAFIGLGPLETTPDLIVGILLIVLAYVVGQVVGNVSGFLLEGLLVKEGIGEPSEILFAEEDGTWRSRLFPGYTKPLPEAIRDRARRRMQREEIGTAAGLALLIHCYSHVKKEAVPQARLTIFQNLYGFCRNCSLALLLVAACLIAGMIHGTAETGIVAPGWWVAAALTCAVGLFYRYLKFFRHYAFEVFSSYAEGS
jgi:hypothetical protein